jgi:hypothetical protein
VKTGAWKTTAWNGVRFDTPALWQIASIGNHHLVLDGPAGPALEIIWRQVKGRFSHRTHLKRISARVSRNQAKGFKAWSPPEEWRSAVSAFEASGFEWRASGEHGRGLLLFCPTCRTASLIHFFWSRLDDPGPLALHILNSFSDHRREEGQFWGIFDIRATLPTPFVLDHYRFTAGKFELAFAHRRNRLILHRWALAAVALKDKTLAEFGQSVGLMRSNTARVALLRDFDAVEERRAAGGLEAWVRWVTGRPGHYLCRLWHVEACNRILGVVAETRRPMDTELFERLCRHYETI